jgi:transcriptional regulator with GAF, ATPase, and Fis domain
VDPISLQRSAASIARQHEVESVLRRVVAELHAQPNVALARIWLLDQSEHCDVCAKAQAGCERTAALHLAAGAGTSLHPERNEDWSKLTGNSRCIQLGSGKVGRIAATGESVFVADAGEDQRWSLNREWVRSESIASFAGYALQKRDETLGVLVLFSRERWIEADFELLAGFADLAAIAIGGARDFAAIEHRCASLEAENGFLRAELDRIHTIGQVIGNSPAFGKLQKQIASMAESILPFARPDARTAAPTLTRDELRRLEAENLCTVLEETNWKIYGPRGAAEALKMRPTTLASRLRSLGIQKPTG